MNKNEKLKGIAEKIANCSICRKDTLGLPVVGEGDSDAQVMFVGEAPGKKEAETGRPFIGRSGQLLRKDIREIGLSEEDVFITSVCKYLPRKGTPSPTQIKHARIYLQQQIDIINPKIIVLLGSVACKGVLNMQISVAKHHGTIIVKDGRKCFITYHPAAAIRFRKNLIYFEQDFQRLKEILGAL